MENTMVSARVPNAKKKRAVNVLSSIGATTSDLINSALDYVIKNEALPGTEPAESDTRTPADFASFVAASTLEVDWSREPLSDYKEFMRRERLADYESLA